MKPVTELDDLLKAAAAQPGVADVLRLYGQHAEALARAEEYVARGSRIVTFAASGSSVV